MRYNILFQLVMTFWCCCFAASNWAGVLFNDLGGDSGFGNYFDVKEDDDSLAIDLTSAFSGGIEFFGRQYQTLYLNENGYISFGEVMDDYAPFDINASSDIAFIAPFFADVMVWKESGVEYDPVGNSTGSNAIYWALSDGMFTATWDDVTPYWEHDSTTASNAFQLQLIARDDIEEGALDIIFNYESINWTQGEYETEPAHIGWSAGDGIHSQEFPESGNVEALLGLSSVTAAFPIRKSDVSEPTIISYLFIFSLLLARKKKGIKT